MANQTLTEPKTQKPARLLPSPASTQDPTRIYVACLASYNNDTLHGRWIDATQGEAHIWHETRAMLAASPEPDAEEWAIHDYEGFAGAPISEWQSFETVANMAEFIAEHDSLGGKLLEYYDGNIEDAKTALESYYGEFESLEDYARQQTEDCGTKIPDNLAYYIDYKSMGRDWEQSGDIFTVATAYNEIHIFGTW